MSSRRKQWGTGVAFAAAFLLFFQTMVAALAIGLSPNPAQLDIFGNPLCITSDDQHGIAGTGSNHSAMPNCCELGCAASATIIATPPEAGWSSLETLSDGALSVRPSYAAPPAVRAYEPGNPRAPPFAV